MSPATRRSLVHVSALALAATACSDPAPVRSTRRTLQTYARAYGPGDPLWSPQPHRDRPLRVAVSPDGARAWVTLQGLEDEPGREVAVVDLRARRVVRRIVTGASPTGVAVHPGGCFVVVTNRFDDRASVIDAREDRVVAEVPTEFYATDVAFTPDGARAYVTNRWRHTVTRWNLRVDGARFEVTDPRAATLSVGTHPRDIAVSPDGTRLAVAALDGLTLHLFELPSERALATVNLRAPVNDVVFVGPWLYALTQGAGSGHPPLVGPDTDEDGRPGDSTANENFQDQQNEIALVRASDGAVVRRYTSDTACCRDWRDVSPEHPTLGAFLPPRADWIIHGAVPEAAAVCGPADAPTLAVTYQGSSDVELFRVDLTSGALTSVTVGSVGFAPTSIACAAGVTVTVSHLGETLDVVGADGRRTSSVTVGDLRAGAFPSTDAEVGELVNIATAPFTVDGDQTCVMCHREFGNVDKPFSMPLLVHPEGTRMTMPHRGLADTRPWFFEGAMDENNFFPVLNEFARVENFCCTDPAQWTPQNPAPPDCVSRPPPVCATRPWPRSYPDRNAFYLDQARRVLGRTRTFGDAFDAPLNFQGLTRALGLSLLHRSRLLPNPNARDTAAVRRGESLFFSRATGCGGCHDGPGLAASARLPSAQRLHFGPVITPLRSPDGRNLDLVSDGFRATFPDTVMRDGTIEFSVPSLRGVWAHARRFLHDGRARSLREVIATPGHPSLRPGERGFNEVDGVPDTHGATSHLSAAQIEDLIAFLEAQ